MRSLKLILALLLGFSLGAAAQTVKVVHNVNLRPDPSSEYPPIRLLTPSEPPLTLLEPGPESGYFHVASAHDTGYVWGKYVKVSAAEAPSSTTINPGPGVDGSASMTGCGDGRWQHVYNPSRLIVLQDCVTITGRIVDATAGRESDGVRHEADGDTHGWLKVDPQFASLINAGNKSKEDSNLVFEIVCHYKVTQTDAKPACHGYADSTVIPPVGSHVAMTGTLVREKNHQKWNEIHPVSRIQVQ